MWVLRRIPDGAFVAKDGSPSSYTRALQNAKVFSDEGTAQHDRCPENEIVVRVEAVMGR